MKKKIIVILLILSIDTINAEYVGHADPHSEHLPDPTEMLKKRIKKIKENEKKNAIISQYEQLVTEQAKKDTKTRESGDNTGLEYEENADFYNDHKKTDDEGLLLEKTKPEDQLEANYNDDNSSNITPSNTPVDAPQESENSKDSAQDVGSSLTDKLLNTSSDIFVQLFTFYNIGTQQETTFQHALAELLKILLRQIFIQILGTIDQMPSSDPINAMRAQFNLISKELEKIQNLLVSDNVDIVLNIIETNNDYLIKNDVVSFTPKMAFLLKEAQKAAKEAYEVARNDLVFFDYTSSLEDAIEFFNPINAINRSLDSTLTPSAIAHSVYDDDGYLETIIDKWNEFKTYKDLTDDYTQYYAASITLLSILQCTTHVTTSMLDVKAINPTVIAPVVFSTVDTDAILSMQHN